jgi:hypothetical protein
MGEAHNPSSPPPKRPIEIAMPSTGIKTIDEKGRVTLGKEFAGRAVEVVEDENEVRLRFMEMVPANEAWLWKNEIALASVRRGLEQAAEGTLGPGPGHFDEAMGFADEIPDSAG